MLFHNLNSTAEKSDFFIESFMDVPLYMVINSFKYWTAIYGEFFSGITPLGSPF